MKESDILYEANNCYIIRTDSAYEVYRCGVTHAKRIAIVGLSMGLDRAKRYCQEEE